MAENDQALSLLRIYLPRRRTVRVIRSAENA